MSNYDILTLQSETAKRHIEFAIKTEFQNCFIHGVGEECSKQLDFYWDVMTILILEGNYQKIWSGCHRGLQQNKINNIVLKKGPVCNYKWDLLCLFFGNK
jgi:hypothetical protein